MERMWSARVSRDGDVCGAGCCATVEMTLLREGRVPADPGADEDDAPDVMPLMAWRATCRPAAPSVETASWSLKVTPPSKAPAVATEGVGDGGKAAIGIGDWCHVLRSASRQSA